MSRLDAAPIPLLGLLVFVLLFVGVEFGYRVGLRRRRGGEGEAGGEGQGQLLSAVLGLLALLLGFTFSLALNRYEARRELVVQEANAIGTAWLRVQILKEPERARLRALLPAYVDARLAWSRSRRADSDNGPSEALQRRIWEVVGSAMRSEPQQQLSRSLMDAANQSFDAASARVAERAAHIPDWVLSLLLLYAVLAMVMLGYTLAADGRRRWIPTGLLLILLTLAVVIILDLDRPRSGAIQVSQQPLAALRASMR